MTVALIVIIALLWGALIAITSYGWERLPPDYDFGTRFFYSKAAGLLRIPVVGTAGVGFFLLFDPHLFSEPFRDLGPGTWLGIYALSLLLAAVVNQWVVIRISIVRAASSQREQQDHQQEQQDY